MLSIRFAVAILCCCLAVSVVAKAQGGNESQHVFYVDTNQHLDQWYVYENANFTVNAFQDVTVAASVPLVGVGSGLTSLFLSGSEHVFFEDSSQHIEHLSNNGRSN
jgi:hypothetical protein